MAEVTQQQVVDYIKGISVLELSQLVKTLESELGGSAVASAEAKSPRHDDRRAGLSDPPSKAAQKDRLRAPISPRGLKNVQPSQERLPRAHRLFENQDDRSDSEPDRDPEEVLRTLPADEPSAERARGRGSPVGVQIGLPDQRLPRELVARVHRVLDRELGVQVRQAIR